MNKISKLSFSEIKVSRPLEVSQNRILHVEILPWDTSRGLETLISEKLNFDILFIKILGVSYGFVMFSYGFVMFSYGFVMLSYGLVCFPMVLLCFPMVLLCFPWFWYVFL
jgi:hypothetical protein